MAEPPSDERRRTPEKRPEDNGGVISDKAANVIIGVVTTIWAANILLGMFEVRGWQPSTEINGIFMTIVGGAFIARARMKGGGE